MSNNFHTLSEIQEIPIYRIHTGSYYINKMFGKSNINGFDQYGIPRGKIILMSGGRGAGKSRLCIALTGFMSNENQRILYFQQEVSKEEFKDWTKVFPIDYKKFFVSECSEIEEQLTIIEKVCPDVVVVDSLNMIQGIRSINKCEDILRKYKAIAEKKNITFILIGFLNKEGKAKGNNDIEYLVDVICQVRTLDQKQIPIGKEDFCRGMFIFEIVDKNRYGEVGNWVCLKHISDGIEPVYDPKGNPVNSFSSRN